MKKAFRLTLALLLVLAFCAGLAACGGNGGTTASPSGDQTSAAPPSGSGEQPGAQERSKTLHMGVGYKPTSLDPHDIRNYSTVVIADFPFESLLYTLHDGAGYYPRLAESWEISEDGTTWTFKLRQGITFHGGNPFTADDVVYSVDRVVNGEDLNTRNMYMPTLAGAEKVDEFTVNISFSKANPDGNGNLCNLFIIDSKAHTEMGADYFALQECYGTGPWVLEEWVDGQHAKFSKNPNYWDKANYDPFFEEIFVHFLAEPSSAIAAHLSGTVETYAANGGISSDMVALYQGTEDKIELLNYESNNVVNMCFSFAEGSPFLDDNFRKAFDLAINRQLIIDTIYSGTGAAMPIGMQHKSVVGYDESLGAPEYNPEKARELLAQSNYDGSEVELMYSTTLVLGEELSLTLADMCQEVGINLVAALEDHAVLSTRLGEGDYQVYLLQQYTTDGRPFQYYERVLSNHNKTDIFNWSGYDQYVSIIDKMLGENGMDPANVEAASKELNQFRFENKVHSVPLVYRNLIQAQNHGITGIGYYPDGLLTFSRVDWDPSLAS